MAKQNLLIVDADQRSLKVLEVSLRKAGYSVATCGSVAEAFEMIELSKPEMILSDTRLPDVDGFQLVEKLRESPETADIPFMFLSSDVSVESKVRGLQLGVADYLTKPIYIKEIITRVQLELSRRQREGLERRSIETKTRFSGSLSDMGLVDLLQTIDISRKSGVLYLSNKHRRGAIYFSDGAIRHATLHKLKGDAAVYRFLVWNEGEFDLEFRPVRIDETTITMSTQGLLMEGMRRVDEWGRLLEQLPSLDSVFEVNESELVDRLAEIPDEINDILRLFDGRRTLLEVVDERAGDDLEVLTAISKLYFEGLIVDGGIRAPESDVPKDSSEPPAHHEEEIDEETAFVPGDHELPPSGSFTIPQEPPKSAAEPLRAEEEVPPGQGETEVEAASSSTPDVADAPATSEPAREELVAHGAEDEMAKKNKRAAKSKSMAPAAVEAPLSVEESASPVSSKVAAVSAEIPTTSAATAVETARAPDAEMRASSERLVEAKVEPAPAVEAKTKDEPLLESKSRPAAKRQKPAASDIEALSQSGEHQLATTEFFESKKEVAPPPPQDDFSDLEAIEAGLTPNDAKFKKVTLGLALLGGLAIGGFLLYAKVLTPQPAELSGGAAPPMPPAAPVEPSAATPAAVPTPPPAPAPEAVAPAPAEAVPPAAPAVPTPEAAAPAVVPAPAPAPAAPTVDTSSYDRLLAEARAKRGRAAEDAYRAAISANPNGSEALADLGLILLEAGRSREARELAARATTIDPTNSKGWITLGAALQTLGDRDGARTAYRSCVEHGQGRYVADCRRFAR